MQIAPAASLRGAPRARRQVDLAPCAAHRGGRRRGAVVRGLGRSLDTESTLAAVRELGVAVAEEEPDVLRVRGAGLGGLQEPSGSIDCGNAGTLARLLPGLLAGQYGRCFELTGDESLRLRPMERIAAPLSRRSSGRARPAAAHGRGTRADGHRARAARRERAGEVVRPPGRPQRGRTDDGRRARPHAGSHRADAAYGGGEAEHER